MADRNPNAGMGHEWLHYEKNMREASRMLLDRLFTEHPRIMRCLSAKGGK